MAKWVVGILLILSLVGGGVGRLALALRPDLSQFSEKSLSKTDLIILGIVNIIVSGLGLIFLLTRMFSPWPILLGVSVVTGLLFIILQLKSRRKLWFKS